MKRTAKKLTHDDLGEPSVRTNFVVDGGTDRRGGPDERRVVGRGRRVEGRESERGRSEERRTRRVRERTVDVKVVWNEPVWLRTPDLFERAKRC